MNWWRAACFANTYANPCNQQGTEALGSRCEHGHHAPDHQRQRDDVFADTHIRPTGDGYAGKGIEDRKRDTAKQA